MGTQFVQWMHAWAGEEEEIFKDCINFAPNLIRSPGDGHIVGELEFHNLCFSSPTYQLCISTVYTKIGQYRRDNSREVTQDAQQPIAIGHPSDYIAVLAVLKIHTRY